MERITNDNYMTGERMLVGGIFPQAVIDKEFFDGLGRAKNAPELSGLRSWGLTSLPGLDLEDFDIPKVAEIYELGLLYYCKTLQVDPMASLDNIQVLTQLLLAQSNANNYTGVRLGDLVLGLWLAGFEFDRNETYKGGLAFYMNYESGLDAESYRWSKEGFDKIMCLIGGFKRAFIFE